MPRGAQAVRVGLGPRQAHGRGAAPGEALIRVPAFVVIGGGTDGALYVRQLARACAAGRLEAAAIRVVDRNPACVVAGLRSDLVRLEVGEWSDWLDTHLSACDPDDHLVPYHWAPHLLVEWLRRAAERAGGRARRGGEVPAAAVPMERVTRDGDRALSYATWMCPPTCIEPALCPHTRGPKDWSLAGRLATLAGTQTGLDEALVFRCLHLVYGVGTIPMAAIHAARERVLAGLAHGPRRYLVATSSHCHALATLLTVEPG